MRAVSVPRVTATPRQLARGNWPRAGYVLADVFLVCFNGFLTFYLRFSTELEGAGLSGIRLLAQEYSSILDEYLAFLLLYIILIALFLHSQDLYRTPPVGSGIDEAVGVVKAVAFATLLLTAFIYLSGVKTVSRLVVGTTGVLNVFTLAGWRLVRREHVRRQVAEGTGGRNVVIVGLGQVGQDLADYFESKPELGYVVKGFLDDRDDGDSRLLGRIKDLPRVARAFFIDEVFVTVPSQRELVKSIAVEARQSKIDVKVVPELYDGMGWRAPIGYLGDFPVMELHSEPIPALGLILKRTLDVVVSAAGLVTLAPLFVVIAVAIRLDSPGPTFYRSLRIGKKGRKFICYKLRTMVANADDLKEDLRQKNERQGPFFKISDDPRLTRVGRFLRKYSLDELPQLWNVFRGEMSLVGPRPHPIDDYERYDWEHLRRLDVTPGITGLWQVSARRDPSFERNMALDLEYIENWSFWLDLKILLRTVPVVLRGMGQ